MLWHFLHFRLDVVTRRLENELASLEKRIHILDGFALIFDALGYRSFAIIRKSDGKSDAAAEDYETISGQQRWTGCRANGRDPGTETLSFGAIGDQFDLGRTERTRTNVAPARFANGLLKEDTKDTNASGRWKIVRDEIESIVIAQLLQGQRVTENGERQSIPSLWMRNLEYTAEDFIVAEDCHVLGDKAMVG